jgi:hypothetical protein
VGTLPLDVLKFAQVLKRGDKAADYIEAILSAVADDLKYFAHEPILCALKKSPDGIRASNFQGVWDKGVHLGQPKQVAVAMKEQKGIIYHLPSREYRMASRAHRTALLERWKPAHEHASDVLTVIAAEREYNELLDQALKAETQKDKASGTIKVILEKKCKNLAIMIERMEKGLTKFKVAKRHQ